MESSLNFERNCILYTHFSMCGDPQHRIYFLDPQHRIYLAIYKEHLYMNDDGLWQRL